MSKSGNLVHVILEAVATGQRTYIAQDTEGVWRPAAHPWADDAQIVVEGAEASLLCDSCESNARARVIADHMHLRNLFGEKRF